MVVAVNAGILAVFVGVAGQRPWWAAAGPRSFRPGVFASLVRLRRLRTTAIGPRFGWIVGTYEIAHGDFLMHREPPTARRGPCRRRSTRTSPPHLDGRDDRAATGRRRSNGPRRGVACSAPDDGARRGRESDGGDGPGRERDPEGGGRDQDGSPISRRPRARNVAAAYIPTGRRETSTAGRNGSARAVAVRHPPIARAAAVSTRTRIPRRGSVVPNRNDVRRSSTSHDPAARRVRARERCDRERAHVDPVRRGHLLPAERGKNVQR